VTACIEHLRELRQLTQGDSNLISSGKYTAKRIAGAIFDLAPIGIEIYDEDGRLVEANTRCREMFGGTDGSYVKGDNLFEDPDLPPEKRAALREGTSASYEVAIDFDAASALARPTTRRSGKIYLSVVVEPTRERPEGPVLNYIVLYQDITQRKLAELALRDSEERFRKVFEEGRIGMVIVDRKVCFVRANAAFCAFTGYSEEELCGLTFKDITHPEHVAADLENVRKVAAGDLPFYRTEKRYIRKDGRVVWGVANVTVVRDDHGGFLHFLTTVEDVTERKCAERELAEISERLALATSSGRLGVWDWDVQENVMLWDDRMLELYGITRNQFSQDVDAWRNGLHPDDRQRALDECQQALDGVRAWDTEFRALHPDGQVVHIKADGIVIRNHEGNPVRMIGINADITERKRTEEALQNTQRLESLALLAGGIAHDFNNLLTAIYGYAELARHDSRPETIAGDPETIAGDLTGVLATIDRARALTRQLLTFARGGEPIREVAPLFPFVQEAAHFALSGSNVSCRFEVAGDLRPCSFDKNQIGQVIDNLVINAQQAMPSGGMIEVRAQNAEIRDGEHPALQAGWYVRLSVHDCGMGIPRELLSRVFDPFFTTKPKGHGLGLATCYSIVKRHGGCIEVESELGKGTIVHVYLPASTQLAQRSSQAARAEHQGRGTVLVMDDEEVVREIASRMLQACGYTVLCREDGRGALEFFEQERKAGRVLAGMILDLTIPGGMGGEETVRAIRKLDANVPVFVASGYAEDPVMANPRAYGFTASLCKPFRLAELKAMLERNMERNGGTRG